MEELQIATSMVHVLNSLLYPSYNDDYRPRKRCNILNCACHTRRSREEVQLGDLKAKTVELALSRARADRGLDFETVLRETEHEVSVQLARILAQGGLVTVYDVGEKYQDEDGAPPVCGVCQDEIACGQEAKAMEQCKHLYHADCIVEWLKVKNICPMCRSTSYC